MDVLSAIFDSDTGIFDDLERSDEELPDYIPF